MESSSFIVIAYSITALLLGVLCLSTWLKARRVRQQLAERDDA